MIAVGACMAQVAVKPGPDAGGKLPESVQNEVDVAIERGLKWLEGQQNKDGSFGKGETNQLFFTSLIYGIAREKKPLGEKPFPEAYKWMLAQQADDGGFGGKKTGTIQRGLYSIMLYPLVLREAKMEYHLGDGDTYNSGLAYAKLKKWNDYYFDPTAYKALVSFARILSRDWPESESQPNWREKLAAKHLSAQIVNGGAGHWKAKDVTARVKKDDLYLWEAHWGMEEVTPSPAGDNGEYAIGRFPSDLAATLFVICHLLNL